MIYEAFLNMADLLWESIPFIGFRYCIIESQLIFVQKIVKAENMNEIM